ncbi:hypothetical protein M514_11753 [Trichuris suis]|uniref:HTH CENPB-type domain-containing protein n=1 Tax=Trichuris suis TaxID=68888 RepID=A0A085MVX3_9BILA|nr:hypothetical protein M513_11753 [Trichuris suis]KFD61369.1 hypothetical protein M514_11753 [Trichuris suis]
MGPEEATKPKKTRKCVPLSSKLEVFRRFDHGERSVDIVRAVSLSASTIRSMYLQKDKILKAAEVTVGNRKVVTLSKPQIMDRMESLLLEWIGGCGDRGVPLSYLIIREKAVRLFNKLKQKALEEGDESLAQVEFSGSRGWFHRFLKGGQLRRLKLIGESFCRHRGRFKVRGRTEAANY